MLVAANCDDSDPGMPVPANSDELYVSDPSGAANSDGIRCRPDP